MRSATLRTLADRLGILPEYIDQSGRERRLTSDDTRVALLAAMGIEAGDEAAARRALECLEHGERERLLAPVCVMRSGAGAPEGIEVIVPGARSAAVSWSLTLTEESEHARRQAGGHSGRVMEAEGSGYPGASGTLTIPLPTIPSPGYHTLRLRVDAGGRTREAEQSFIVVPRRCPTLERVTGRRRVFAVVANLYSVRSSRNWGVGDLTDLAELLRWSGEIGAALVGVNPLHALRNQGWEISPYSPVSRLFRNPLYLDLEAVAELPDSPEACDLMAAEPFRRELERLRTTDRVEYEAVMALKHPVLQALHRTFAARHLAADTARGRAYRRYVESGGEPLTSFATFCALEEHFAELQARAGAGTRRADGRMHRSPGEHPSGRADTHPAPRVPHPASWPPEYRDPRSPAVVAFREAHAERVEFHRYLQFLLQCQLARADVRSDRASSAGLYQDLAIGTSPTGSDVWAFPHLFVDGASIGAPPDDYSKRGQNWGLPPLDPRALANDSYRYWILLLRSAFSGSRALRIDHVLGLFRQFWIPSGREGKDGAYVRFPTHDLLGILALEATRAGALVVGEDLGTVPPEVPPTLKDWGILGSKVLYFERDADGGFLPAASYEAESFTAANTHDMPTLAGFWKGRDIALKHQVGMLDADEANAARMRRAEERTALLERLAADGALPEPSAPDDPAELNGAVHDFLCRTPAAVVGLSLDDIVGETEPVNLPGVGLDRYPSWTRRLTIPLERLRTDDGVRQALGGCPRSRGA